MKTLPSVLLCVGITLLAACRHQSSEPTEATQFQSFATQIRDTSGTLIASGVLSLPANITNRKQFSGSCKIRVSRVPQQPATEYEHAVRCLSESNGSLSGRLTDSGIRIALHPQIDDHTIYLEGRMETVSFKGTWFYQSYAGYQECGGFEARVETNTP